MLRCRPAYAVQGRLSIRYGSGCRVTVRKRARRADRAERRRADPVWYALAPGAARGRADPGSAGRADRLGSAEHPAPRRGYAPTPLGDGRAPAARVGPQRRGGAALRAGRPADPAKTRD